MADTEEIPLPLHWPVYVSHAEATAYAQWAGKKLPTEAQWQRAAQCKFEIRCVVSGEAMARRKGVQIGHGYSLAVYPQAQRRGSDHEFAALGLVNAFAPVRAQEKIADFKHPQGGHPDVVGGGGV